MSLLEDVAQKYAEFQIETRRHFHLYPEESEKEFKTAEHIRDVLTQAGIEWRVCGMPTGTLATIRGAKPGKTILLRGDIDGLSVVEQTGLPFKSQHEGFMHACGHDCHASMLLTAALIINDMKESFEGTVVLAFQPAEEIGKGAKAMVADGALNGVDAAFGMHVWPQLPSGTVTVPAGPRTAGGDFFEIEVKGTGGHGAAPHMCVDAALVASSIVTNLQSIVSREMNPIDTAVITVGTIDAGTRWNVVAENATMTGTARYFSKEAGEMIPQSIERIAMDIAHSYRAQAEFRYERPVLPTNNDAGFSKLCEGAALKVLGEDSVKQLPPSMVGEDFCYFMETVPAALAFFGVGNEACNAIYGLHHNKFTADEDALLKGAKYYAQIALDFMQK